MITYISFLYLFVGSFIFGISIKSIYVILFFIQIAISVPFNKEDQSIYIYCELLIYLELFLLPVFYLSFLSFAYFFLLF